MQAALGIVPGPPPPVDPEAALVRGHALRRDGALAQARIEYEVALAAFAEICDGLGEAVALAALGQLALEDDDPPLACERLSAALRVWRASGDLRAVTETLAALGDAQRRGRRSVDARASFTEAVRLARRVGDRVLTGTVLVQAAHFEEDEGAVGVARQFLERAAKLFRQAGDARGQAGAFAGLGLLHRNTDRPRHAAQHFARAIELCEQLGDRTATAWLEEQLSAVQPHSLLDRRLPSQAEPRLTPQALLDAGRLALVEGHADDALRSGDQLVTEAHLHGRRLLAAEGHCLIAEAHLAEGRAAAGRAALGRALAELGEDPAPARVRVLVDLARVELLEADLPAARSRVEEAWALADDPPAATLVAGVLVELGDTEDGLGDRVAAERWWQQCVDLSSTCGEQAATRAAVQRLVQPSPWYRGMTRLPSAVRRSGGRAARRLRQPVEGRRRR